MTGVVARAHITIEATPAAVWTALTDPVRIKEYMFGADVVADWRPGGSITWSGVYDGQAYQDKGEVIAVAPSELLVFTHLSGMSGAADVPENYHRVTYALAEVDAGTQVELTQDNNPDDQAAAAASTNWQHMLIALKAVVEGS